jgi:hypothetical protein
MPEVLLPAPDPVTAEPKALGLVAFVTASGAGTSGIPGRISIVIVIKIGLRFP